MKYRPEINGLRAIAVCSVIFFHASLGPFEGGFLGVDVFFVLSGYLITGIISEALDKENFSFVEFYSRRAKRLLPALFVVLICTLPFAWLLMFSDQMKSYFTALGCVGVFLSNIFYATQAGYFAPNAAEDPLIHTWSLSVEEQFYLVMPAVLVIASRYGKSFRLWICVTLFCASLLYAWLAVQQRPDITFFDPLARTWELLAGACACLSDRQINDWITRNRISKNALSLIGLMLLGACFSLSSSAYPHPSAFSIIAVLSTILLLATCSASTHAGKMLSSRPFSYFGLTSYSAYLWHQPLLAFGLLARGQELGTTEKLLLIVATFGLAHLTWKYVEQPFRYGKWHAKFSRFAFAGLPIVFVIGLAGHSTNGFESYRQASLPPALADTFQSGTPDWTCEPSFENAPAGTDFCKFGMWKSSRRIAVFGDSHSFAIIPAFMMAAEQYKIGIVHNGLGGCPPLTGVYVINGNHPAEICKRLVNNQIRYVAENRIADVYLVGRWSLYTDGSYHKGSRIYLLSESPSSSSSQEQSRRSFEASLRQTVRKYKEMGVRVHLMTQAPMQLFNARNIYNKWYSSDSDDFEAHLKISSVPYSIHQAHQNFVMSTLKVLASEEGFDLIDIHPEFCDGERCTVGNTGESFYQDDDHLSAAGARRTFGRIFSSF